MALPLPACCCFPFFSFFLSLLSIARNHRGLELQAGGREGGGQKHLWRKKLLHARCNNKDERNGASQSSLFTAAPDTNIESKCCSLSQATLLFLLATLGKCFTSTSLFGSQPVCQPVSRFVSRSAGQPVSRSARQPVSRSARQPVSPSARQPVSPSASQPVSQSASQPVSQSASSFE